MTIEYEKLNKETKKDIENKNNIYSPDENSPPDEGTKKVKEKENENFSSDEDRSLD